MIEQLEVEDDLLQSVKSNITYIANIQDAKGSNIYIVTVPTSIDLTNRPDLTPLIKSFKDAGLVLNKDDVLNNPTWRLAI
jgi:UDP-N-acetyl-D-glucosamine/UDP-N-acetyl-D-galactosamine dehydrogenase